MDQIQKKKEEGSRKQRTHFHGALGFHGRGGKNGAKLIDGVTEEIGGIYGWKWALI